MAFDHIGVAFLDDRGQALERGALGFFNGGRIDHDHFFPAAVIREGDAHDVIGRLRRVGNFGFAADEVLEFVEERTQQFQWNTAAGVT